MRTHAALDQQIVRKGPGRPLKINYTSMPQTTQPRISQPTTMLTPSHPGSTQPRSYLPPITSRPPTSAPPSRTSIPTPNRYLQAAVVSSNENLTRDLSK